MAIKGKAVLVQKNSPYTDRLERDRFVLLKALQEAQGALNKCERYFLGTGPQPSPEDLAPVDEAIRAALSQAQG